MELELLRKQKKGELVININSNLESLDIITIQKMAFIYNSIESGWSVNKKMINLFLIKNMKEKKKFF